MMGGKVAMMIGVVVVRGMMTGVREVKEEGEEKVIFAPVLPLFCPCFAPVLPLFCPCFAPVLPLFCPISPYFPVKGGGGFAQDGFMGSGLDGGSGKNTLKSI